MRKTTIIHHLRFHKQFNQKQFSTELVLNVVPLSACIVSGVEYVWHQLVIKPFQTSNAFAYLRSGAVCNFACLRISANLLCLSHSQY